MAVKQYKEPGVCRQVDENTVDPNGMWLRATDVGSLDELMADLAMYRYIVSALSLIHI